MAYIGNPLQTATFLTDTFNGDNSTVAYTLQVAPANTASILVAVDGVVQEPSTYGLNGTTLTFSEAPPTGTDNISIRYLGIPANVIDDTAYRTVTEFTATASQTTFTVPSYTVGYVNVYRNGLKLGTSDFTASSGTTVVLGSAANSGDLIVVEAFRIESINNAIPSVAGAVTTNYILDEAITPAKLDSDTDFTINGLTVGKGANAISTNTAFGVDALDANTTANDLTAIGYRSLYNNTIGVQNTALGRNCMVNNTTGSYNSAMGYAALSANTTANNNTAVGFLSLAANTVASNTAVGWGSLYSNTTGSPNTAVGWGSLFLNTTGSNNVGLGFEALRNNTTASQNTAVGYQALYTNAASYNTAVGYKALDVSNASNNTAIGNEAGGQITSGSNNTIIGAGAGNYTIPLTTGSNNILIGALAQPSSATVSNEITLGDANVTSFRIPGVSFNIDGSGNLSPTGGIYLGGTAAVNLLDDYEEGTWTPTLSGSTTAGSATYTTQLGGYVKIGKQVIAQCFIHLSGAHTGTGACKVSLPFVASSNSVSYGGATVTYKSNWVGNGPDFMQGEAGVNFGYLRYDNNTTMADLNLATTTTTNTTVMLIINYQAA